MSTNAQDLLFAIAAVAALALLLQTLFVIALLVMGRKAMKRVQDEMEHYRSTVMPLILQTRDLLQNLTPKIEATIEDVNAMVKRLREQTADIQAAANDILERTRHQASRVDGMLTSVFDRLERAGTFMSDSVARPMRQINGIVASVKAAVESLREPHAGHRRRTPAQTATPSYSDGENIPGPHSTGAVASYRP